MKLFAHRPQWPFFRAITLFLLTFVLECHASAATKPNIIVLIADDLGIGDVGFSGGTDIPTPHLDRLAGEGVVFRNGYASSMCAPTRAAFLTGRNPEKIGFVDNRPGDSPHFGMDLSLKTAADILREAGYVTALIGKWHLGRGLHNEYSPWNRGFAEFFGYFGAFGTYTNPRLTRPPGPEELVEGYSTDIFADAACDFLRRHKNKPFFLNVAFNAAHLKHEAKPEDLEKFPQIENPKRRMAAAIISNLDENIGRIAAQLKELNLDRNTLIFFFSDNGGEPPILATFNGPLRGMKFDVYEGGIRVPFFARWPDGLPAGKSCNALISVMDLLPTMAAVAGTQAPRNCDGVNLIPYLSGKTKREPHANLFWRVTEHAALQRLRKQPNAEPPVYIPYLAAVRDTKWKLVVHDDTGKKPVQELYDLSTDIGEKNDIAAKHPKVVRQLAKKLDSWRATLKPQFIPPGPKRQQTLSK